mgnify:CR=1 FL=1
MLPQLFVDLVFVQLFFVCQVPSDQMEVQFYDNFKFCNHLKCVAKMLQEVDSRIKFVVLLNLVCSFTNVASSRKMDVVQFLFCCHISPMIRCDDRILVKLTDFNRCRRVGT